MATESEQDLAYAINAYEAIVRIMIEEVADKEKLRQRLQDLEVNSRKLNLHANLIDVIKHVTELLPPPA